MVGLDAVRLSNHQLTTSIRNRFTALFVGGTSGIGRSTLRQLARHAGPLTLCIGIFRFLEADVSLVRNVDRVCEEVRRREETLNLLFMTPGGISLGGRKDTNEGIDTIFALRYYARMRFVQNLLPLMENTAPSRVLSILGGGFEGPISTDDLDLQKKYSAARCALHATTMTSLAMEHLAETVSNPDLSFIHTFPGIVDTNIYSNSFPPAIAAIYNYGVWPLMKPFSVALDESGERHLFHSTSARFPGKGSGSTPSKTMGLPKGIDIAIGSNGQIGSGAYLTSWKGETSVGGKFMRRYRESGMPATIWSHTTDLLEKAVDRTGV